MELEKRKEIEKKISNLKRHNHICLLYENSKEQFSVLSALFKFAFNRKDKIIYVNSQTDDEDVIKYINRYSIDIDVKTCSENGDIEIISHKKLCKDATGLNSAGICTAVEKEHQKATSVGYDGLTITLEMTNIVGTDTSLDRFRSHETRFHSILEKNNITGICQYNINRFPTTYIKYMIFTHPLVIYKDCRRIYEL